MARPLVGVNFAEFRQTRGHRRSHWIVSPFEFRQFRRPFFTHPNRPALRASLGTTETWPRQGCRRARWYRMNDA